MQHFQNNETLTPIHSVASSLPQINTEEHNLSPIQVQGDTQRAEGVRNHPQAPLLHQPTASSTLQQRLARVRALSRLQRGARVCTIALTAYMFLTLLLIKFICADWGRLEYIMHSPWRHLFFGEFSWSNASHFLLLGRFAWEGGRFLDEGGPLVGAAIPLLLCGSLLAWIGLRRAHGGVVYTLASAENLSTVGALTDALVTTDHVTRRVAAEALIRLLPRLRVSDVHLLQTPQRRILRRALRGSNTDLALAILCAFEQVGNSQDLVVVDELARGTGRRKGDARLVEAAKACRVGLCQQVAQPFAPQSEQLLRATIQHDSTTDTLLRAVQDNTSFSDPQHLLRTPQSQAPSGR